MSKAKTKIKKWGVEILPNHKNKKKKENNKKLNKNKKVSFKVKRGKIPFWENKS